jgi:glycosyltransferase involved in cell wall biosynthesis
MQNKQPVISVIMPVYNSERFLKEAIESILNQSFEDFEFIIINDGSTDSSEAIILKFNDPRIIYFKNNTNIGVIKTRNIGIDHARGKYIAKMDSDDISLLDRFAVQYDYLENNPACAVLTTNIQLIDEKGNEIGFWEDDLNTKTYEEISTYLPKLNCIAQPAVMAKTEVLKKYKYNINQHCAEDWDLWLRIIADGLRIEKINFCYLKYRIVKNSLTQGRCRLLYPWRMSLSLWVVVDSNHSL